MMKAQRKAVWWRDVIPVAVLVDDETRFRHRMPPKHWPPQPSAHTCDRVHSWLTCNLRAVRKDDHKSSLFSNRIEYRRQSLGISTEENGAVGVARPLRERLGNQSVCRTGQLHHG